MIIVFVVQRNRCKQSNYLRSVISVMVRLVVEFARFHSSLCVIMRVCVQERVKELKLPFITDIKRCIRSRLQNNVFWSNYSVGLPSQYPNTLNMGQRYLLSTNTPRFLQRLTTS